MSINQAQRFIFDNCDIRGEIVQLDSSYQEALAAHAYPDAVHTLLGELIASAQLLSSMLKYEGVMSLQARSEGPISLLMVECTDGGDFRALARFDEVGSETELQQLLPGGQLAITVDPKVGRRYQGIVPMDGGDLAECFSHYFQQSEQLETRVFLEADKQRCCGFLLQALPKDKQQDDEGRAEDWTRINHLASTLKAEEMFTLEAETLLHRLYHEEEVRTYPAEARRFKCNCTRDRTARALFSIGKVEALELVNEKSSIEMDCQFCSARYSFGADDVESIFAKSDPKTMH